MQEKRNIEERLAESLKALIQTEPFEKITIREIVDRVGTTRVTFYNHFRDKYELVEWIIHKQVIEPVGILLQHGMIKEALVLIFEKIYEDRDFYRQAVKMEGQNSLTEIIEKSIHEILLQILTVKDQEMKTRYPWLDKNMISAYYANSLAYIVILWIRIDMKVPPADMADIYRYVGQHSMEDVLQEFGRISPEEFTI